MLSRFERMLIGRYLLPGVGGRIVLLVAAIGMLGVTIGVASLILVMSVMNGAEARLVQQFASIDGDASVTRPGEFLQDWRQLAAAAQATPGVVSAGPAIERDVVASVNGRTYAADLQGLPPDRLATNPLVQPGQALVTGHAPQGDGEVVIGSGLAEQLGVYVGEPVSLMMVRFEPDGGIDTDFYSFRLAGIFHSDNAKYDSTRIVATMPAVQRMVGAGDVVSRIDVKTRDSEHADRILAPLKAKLAGKATLQTWREMNKALFDALAVEHVGMFIVLSLVVLVALFNIMSSLVMLVRSRHREIAIVRTMGASRASVIRIFVAVGSVIGGIGTVVGLAIGLGLVFSKAPLSAALGAQMASNAAPSGYGIFLDMPFIIGPLELVGIVVMTLVGTVLATLFPATRAAAVDPAEVLRYE
ncbi:lipoprotein-releasing system permease protein [Hephaestia caeni]|uniref:Lipoprotein-releasing system permease protein n=1 Tax=Hephaestia caeni TaxID=645617 RepID=A0A397P483_9SPHN|nr:ABC transporter permease [Hephaestia caeni]RIA43668.1 lipoprotein-releasing system permease protein [Hephaestia caeni]